MVEPIENSVLEDRRLMGMQRSSKGIDEAKRSMLPEFSHTAAF
jgi:hypothetical protein